MYVMKRIKGVKMNYVKLVLFVYVIEALLIKQKKKTSLRKTYLCLDDSSKLRFVQSRNSFVKLHLKFILNTKECF